MIAGCSGVVLVLSEHSVACRRCMNLLALAFVAGRAIFSVSLDNAKLERAHRELSVASRSTLPSLSSASIAALKLLLSIVPRMEIDRRSTGLDLNVFSDHKTAADLADALHEHRVHAKALGARKASIAQQRP